MLAWGRPCPSEQVLGRMGVLGTSLGCKHIYHRGTGRWICAKGRWGTDVVPGKACHWDATSSIPAPSDQWTNPLHQSWVGAPHPLIPQSCTLCTHPWAQGRHRGHVRPRTKTWSHVHMDSSSQFLRGKHLQEAAASKSLAGPSILHPQPTVTLSPQPPTLSPPAHPSRCASFFSKSWMTSSSTRMVCWLVSSTPSRDCSWECRSPCSLGPRGPSP